MHMRRPDSLRRTWALLSAAAILYIPANVLPIMNTATLAHDRGDTILSGIVHFWLTGEWLIASIVFIASIMVPMLKISALALLAFTSQRRSRWRAAERTTLYRVVESIGRWSMLDIFVIALTVALVRFGTFGTVTAGPGAIAFGSVVILTMLASMQFDPRLIWDPVSRAAPVGEEPSQYTMEHPHD
jgi:paraquat-inducible protein A